MRYKIYIIKENTENGFPLVFIEADFNYGCGYDSIEEAQKMIEHNGEYYVNYTILPYIYMIS